MRKWAPSRRRVAPSLAARLRPKAHLSSINACVACQQPQTPNSGRICAKPATLSEHQYGDFSSTIACHVCGESALSGEPRERRPGGAWGRTTKWARRNVP